MSGEVYAVILVGGSGTRLWPRSRAKSPKQLIKLGSGKTLLELAADRAFALAGPERTIVITAREFAEPFRGLLPQVPPENIVGEPFPRDTAAAIGLGAVMVRRRDARGVMAVLPADHLIEPVDAFVSVMKCAAQVASDGEWLVTIGIPPAGPVTSYGYIHRDEEIRRVGDVPVWRMGAFREKPDLDTAAEYVRSGDYYWNSGLFAWRALVILEEMRRYMPAHHAAVERVAAAIGRPDFARVLAEAFDPLPRVSIDYGVMEHAENVAVIEATFDWSDVGGWEALSEHLPRDRDANAVEGDFLGIDCHDCIVVMPKGKLVAGVGIDDLIIVDTPDALLVAHRRHEQDVKRVARELMKRGREDLL